MAKLTRVLQRIFGSGAGTDQIAVFGSLFAAAPTFTTDPAAAQSLSNWLTGWLGAAIDGNAPAIEDMNSVLFVYAYQLAYVMQAGVPEWETNTVYYTGSLASVAGVIYCSRTDANQGNLVTDVVNWKKVGGNILSALGDIIYATTGADQAALSGNITTTPAILQQTGTGAASAAPVWRPIVTPTVQRFLSSSGTYTTPTNPSPAYIRVTIAGGGGGGAGTSVTGANGSTGSNTTFSVHSGSAILTANGGGGAQFASGIGGTGGSVTVNSPAISVVAISGGYGGAADFLTNSSGSSGGTNVFGGAGKGGSAQTDSPGAAGVANTGAGGGGGADQSTAFVGGSGGGAGGYIQAIISAPSASYDYSVGAGGAGGGTGTPVGGAGGSGVVIVEEFYI